MFSPAVIGASWRNVAILSWPVEDSLLVPFLPNGLVLDRWGGEGYVSLVCLFMENLRILGLPAIPRRFAEVNLRFYVRPSDAWDDRQGVVFLRQLVSNPLVAFAGRCLFREPMRATRVIHNFALPEQVHGQFQRRVHYRWRNRNHDDALRVTAWGDAYFLEDWNRSMNPHRLWADGPLRVTCFDESREYAPGTITYPMPCRR